MRFMQLYFKAVRAYKRSTDESKSPIWGPYNANKESKYVELVIVVDNREFKELEESTRRVLDHCKNIANIINGLYSPLNIFIALVGVVIWSEYDEITFSKNGDDTLKSLLHYRKDRLILEHPNDNAQQLTKFSFDQGVVGKALKGPMCTYEYSGGVSMDHSPTVGLVDTTIAHEMGHNFESTWNESRIQMEKNKQVTILQTFIIDDTCFALLENHQV
ncbi:snake venom metalloproteinase atroxase-like [Anthonomus grandis grandis]|uniref:snake venom metalloproteinase atroxase-like n=1 Tax=Anthonomus grandis grandis TaxID=2921223 RepID=UPI00216684A6|nr:snake venom metalloproteinase atroxase-like [Anthonomus grandis grandis]